MFACSAQTYTLRMMEMRPIGREIFHKSTRFVRQKQTKKAIRDTKRIKEKEVHNVANELKSIDGKYKYKQINHEQSAP